MERIIFITPFFGNTGSEIALFNLISRLHGYEVIVISKAAGALAHRLPPHIRFHDYQSFHRSNRLLILLLRLRSKIFKSKFSIFYHFLDSVIGSQKALFYVNTIIMPDVVDYLLERNHKFVMHIHELQHMLHGLNVSDISNIINGPDYVITSSLSCKQLYYSLGRTAEIVHCYPGIDISSVKPQCTNSEFRKRLDIASGAFVIAMSGTVTENKNPELFLEIGKILKERGHDIYLLWIGADKRSGYFSYLARLTTQYNLEAQCSWIEHLEGDEYYNYMNIANCFVLTSKQESFSIVLLEALALGKPVFSFASGGPQEIINSESIGFIVNNYLALEMAVAIEKYLKREITFDEDTAKARARDFSCDIIFKFWFAGLKEKYF